MVRWILFLILDVRTSIKTTGLCVQTEKNNIANTHFLGSEFLPLIQEQQFPIRLNIYVTQLWCYDIGFRKYGISILVKFQTISQLLQGFAENPSVGRATQCSDKITSIYSLFCHKIRIVQYKIWSYYHEFEKYAYSIQSIAKNVFYSFWQTGTRLIIRHDGNHLLFTRVYMRHYDI